MTATAAGYTRPISASEDDGNVAIGEGRRKDFSTEEVKFTAPELFWKGESSAAADVYSLGMLLYFACSGGKMPFDEDSAVQPRLSSAA